MKKYQMVKDFFMFIKYFVGLTGNELSAGHIPINSRFASTSHWLENSSLKKILIDKGFNESSLFVTGDPKWDMIFNKIKNERKTHEEKQKKNILLITTNLYEHGFWTKKERDNIFAKIVKEIIKNNDKCNLIVKIHPKNENLKEYQMLINKINSKIEIYQNGDVLDFLENSDVVVTFGYNASASVYALLVNKPLIICNFNDEKQWLFLKKKLAIEVKKPEDIIISIQNIFLKNPASPEKIQDFISEYLYKIDGNSSKRVSEMILKTIEDFPNN